MIGVLPKSLVVGGKTYPIYSDYRVALLIFDMCADEDIDDRYKTLGCIQLLFEDYTQIPQDHLQEAAEKAKWFLDGGDMPKSDDLPQPAINWEQDEGIIFPALNKVAGKEIREAEYMHWWTFLGLFNEVGDGLYTTIMTIRIKKIKGKKLEKHEETFYREHQQLIDIKRKLTPEEQAEIDFVNSLFY